MSQRWLLFLHGINTNYEERWREYLADSVTLFGYQQLTGERVLTPDYRATLKGEINGGREVSNTWKRPSKDELRDAKTRYLARMSYLEARLRPRANGTTDHLRPPEFGLLPPDVSVIAEARSYAKSAAVRAEVQRIVLQSLEDVPAGSEIVILAHSLGTVVAADLLKKLPADLHVNGLVTIGSPLGAVSVFRTRDLDDFPFDRVGSWVNIFEPRDPVTGGRGVAERYPEAIDIPIVLDDWVFPTLIHQHGAEYYCSQGAVATAVAEGLLGSEVTAVSPDSQSAVDGLELLLLQSLYLRELAKRLPADDFDRSTRFMRARQAIAQDHAKAAAMLHQQSATTASLATSDFLVSPNAHIRNAWHDYAVLPLAIMLATGLPASPFTVEGDPDTEERRSALISTLSLIREGISDVTDVDIADAVLSARSEIKGVFAAGRSWLPTLLVTGAVVALAATGVGVMAAVPAGLAGAAVITSTLAAFGPGGMIGGMATLLALASASSALAVAGAAGMTLEVSGSSDAAADLLTGALDEAVASGDADTLQALLSSLLILVAAQETLGFPSQRGQILWAGSSLQAQLAQRLLQHELIDPKSDATKAVKTMLVLVGKATAWLRGEESANSEQAREWHRTCTAYGEALNGDTEALEKLLAAPGPGGAHTALPRPGSE